MKIKLWTLLFAFFFFHALGLSHGAETKTPESSPSGSFHEAGHEMKEGFTSAGHGIKKGGKKTGHAFKKAGKSTGHGFEKAGHEIKQGFQ